MTANVEKIRRMQHIWETQIKPFVVDLIEKEDGQYAAMALVAHACEHAYKAIRSPKRQNVMQESLESALRLYSLLVEEHRKLPVTADTTHHIWRTTAHKIRVLIVNPWKHEGILKGEKTRLINNPIGGLSRQSIAFHGKHGYVPHDIHVVRSELNAHKFAERLISGIDSAYSIFLDDSSPSLHRKWFSPEPCRSALCKECGKELRPCEICKEELESVGEKLREGECDCDGNRESTNGAVRWIRYCEKVYDDPTWPKLLEDDHFLLSDECCFSSICREINSVLIANLPEPVRREGAIWYASGTYTEDEMKAIMRPLREEVDKYLTELERK